MKKSSKSQKDNSARTAVRVGKFAVIGVILAVFNFIIYTFLARVIMNSNELLWVDSIISYGLATILAYILHSKITWKERPVTKRGILMFFVWNGITALAISPFFTWLFGFITPVYEFAHQFCINLHIPFDYEFIESTGIFGFTTCVTMVLNYIFYDKLVFGDSVSDTPQYTYTPELAKLKVSIIVPVYNTAKYLPACLDSILAQTHDNLEIILIDDGSTDDSPKIIKKYAKKDHRIKTIHQKNQGQSAARNAGLKKTTGKYISFIDSDDEIKPNFISELLSLYQNKDNSLSVCGFRRNFLHTNSHELLYTSPSSPRKKSDTDKSYILRLLSIDGRLYSVNNKLFISKIAKSLSFDESINFAEDLKFVLDYLSHTNYIVAFAMEPLYIYNFGSDQSTITKSATIWQNWQTSYQNLKTWLGKKPTTKEKYYSKIVHLRWRISYLRSKIRAKKAHQS